jgi:HmuY protein
MNKLFNTLFALIFILTLNSCKKADPPLPDNLVQFEASEQGLGTDVTEATIKLKLSRSTDVAIPVTITIQPSGVTYGTEFITAPAAVENVISVTIPAGSSEASFKVSKQANVFLSGSESLVLTIKTAGSPVLVGSTKLFTLKFSFIVSAGSEIQLNGLIGSEAGSSAGNSVFVDFSNNQQTAAARASWDLGFFSGNDFRVILNNTTSASARVIAKNELNLVTAEDALPATDWDNNYDAASFNLIDDIRGELTKTVIAEVSANDADNKVYIINPGTGGGIAARPWYKIRILRKGTGYTLQYAKIAETTFNTIDITKDAAYNFQFISLTSGTKTLVEPAKASWDIEWTYSTYETLYGTDLVPYSSADFIALNTKANVQAAEILTSTLTYDAYTENNISATNFSSARDVIGNKWRTASPTAGASGVKTDRFYVLKDAAGNVYKLKCLSFHGDDGGTRGKPKFLYSLVKKGA